MHKEVHDFVCRVKARHPVYFGLGNKVIEVGSCNINGTPRRHFKGLYTGVDITPGPDVDYVGYIHKMEGENLYDVCISTETLEHDEYYIETLTAMYRLVRDRGLILLTCATNPREEHGTRTHNPSDVPAPTDYYNNILISDILDIYKPEKFLFYSLNVDLSRGDLYFYGIAKKTG